MSSITRFGVSFADYLVRKSLKHLILHVTNNCNYRCQHCFIDFSSKRDLKLDRYQALGQEVGSLFWLDIGGGEPFLRKDLSEIIGAFTAEVIGIPSNGSLPDLMEEQIEQMRRVTDAEIIISLSLDGLADTHDAMRREPGSWKQVWSTFERLRRRKDISLKINTVICEQNYQEILDLMREVRGNNPDFHSVILLRGDPMEPTIGLPPLDELRRLGPDIFKILSTYSYGENRVSSHILRNYHRYLWQVSLRTLEQQNQVIPCLGGKAHMVVWGDGKVGSCELLEPIGDIREQTWSEILNSAGLSDQIQFIEDKKCHCTHNCAMLDSIFFNPGSIPKLLTSVEV